MAPINNVIELLDWDTDFFGYKVGSINNGDSKINWNEFFDELSGKEIQLAYFYSSEAINKAGINENIFEIILADKKVTYLKKIKGTANTHSSITAYKEQYPEIKLQELAIESGIYSRFNTDSRISREKFESLYRLWIINSVQKKIASEVLVFSTDKQIDGFVTLGEKNNRGDIGIIAVDGKQRGKSIGKSLMLAAEYWFANHDYTDMQVITQGNNEAACRLYEGCGFAIEKTEYVYHIWRK
jgi:dTDP-4-amino-4,6-dideoxy-D-galactose acyltransferase